MEWMITIAILGLSGALIAEKYFHYKEKIELAKLDKTKSFREVEMMFPSQEVSKNEDKSEDIVPLTEVPDDLE